MEIPVFPHSNKKVTLKSFHSLFSFIPIITISLRLMHNKFLFLHKNYENREKDVMDLLKCRATKSFLICNCKDFFCLLPFLPFNYII